MFLLSIKTMQFLIITGVLLLFITTFILNKRTKAPEGVEVPEKCHSCISTSCIIKKEVSQIKDEMRQAVMNCEEKDEAK